MKQLLDTEKACRQPVSDTDALEDLLLIMRDAKLIFMEPITLGIGDKTINGLIMYYLLSDGTQIAIETSPGECEPDKLYVSLYTE